MLTFADELRDIARMLDENWHKNLFPAIVKLSVLLSSLIATYGVTDK